MFKNLALRVLAALQSIESSVKDEEGQTLAEYGLIMAVIAVAVVAAAAVAARGAGAKEDVMRSPMPGRIARENFLLVANVTPVS